MTTTVNRTELVAALRALRVAAGGNKSLPVLENVAIETTENTLSLTTTNLDVFVRRYVTFKGDPLPSTTAPAQKFGDFVAGFSGDDVKLALDGDRLRLSSGRQKASLATVAFEEFPTFPSMDPAASFTLWRGEFDQVAGRITPFAASDSARPILTGISVVGDGERIRFAAADNYRVGVLTLDHPIEVSAVIPAAAVVAAGKALQGENVTLTLDNRMVMFASQQGILVSRLIEGQFPNIDPIMPKTFLATLLLDRDEYAAAGKLAAVAAALTVTFEGTPEGLHLFAKDYDRDFETTLAATVSVEAPDDIKFALDQKYVNAIAAAFSDSPQVEVGYGGTLAPVSFTDPADPTFRAVVMPVRTPNN